MARLRTAPKPETDVPEGAYLTDGVSLYRVLDSVDGDVLVENCADPSLPPLPMTVDEVRQKMRLVRPEA